MQIEMRSGAGLNWRVWLMYGGYVMLSIIAVGVISIANAAERSRGGRNR